LRPQKNVRGFSLFSPKEFDVVNHVTEWGGALRTWSFSKFQTWYVDALSDSEVTDVLAKLGRPPVDEEPGDWSPQERKELLLRLWRRRSGPSVAIGRALGQPYLPLRERIAGMTIEGIHSSMAHLADEYGVKAVAYVLFVDASDFHRELGTELLIERGDEARVPTPEAEEVAAGTEGLDEEPSHGVCSLQQAGLCLKRVADYLDSEEYGDDLGREAFQSALSGLQTSWGRYLERWTTRHEIISEVRETLRRLRDELSAEVTYFELADRLPLDIDSYLGVELDLAAVAKDLKAIRDACDEARELRSRLGATAREDRDVYARLGQLGGQLEEVVSSLASSRIPVAAEVASPAQVVEAEPEGLSPPGEVVEELLPVATQEGDDEEGEPLPVERGPSLLEAQFWRAVEESNLALAYWLAREYEDSPAAFEEPPERLLPSWLLMALGLGSQADLLRPDMREAWYRIGYEHPNPVKETGDGVSEAGVARLVALAAIRPALLAPETGAIDWLRTALQALGPGSSLVGLLEAVVSYAQRGSPFDPYWLEESLADNVWRQRLIEVMAELREWQDQTARARTAYVLANQVTKYLASPRSEIGAVVERIYSEDSDAGEAVRQLLETHLHDARGMKELVAAGAHEVRGASGRVRQIHGQPLEQILRRLEQLADILRRWERCHSAGERSSDDWRARETASLRESFLESWRLFDEEAAHELDSVQDADEAAALAGRAAGALARDMCRAAAKELFLCQDGEPRVEPGRWHDSLLYPILLLSPPPVQLRDPWVEEPFVPTESLLRVISEGRSVREALDLHLDQGYLLAAEKAIEELERTGPSDSEVMIDSFNAAVAKAERALRERLDAVSLQVEKGLFDHSISDGQRSRLQGELLSIEQSAEEDKQRLPELIEDAKLLEQEIAALRQSREQSLSELLFQMRDGLCDGNGEPVTEDDASRLLYVEKAERALASGDLPQADEYLTYAETGAGPAAPQDAVETPAAAMFCDAQGDIEQSLRRGEEGVAEGLWSGQSFPGISMRDVPGARLTEVRQGLRAYWQIKRKGQFTEDPSLLRDVRRIVEYLGFHNPEVVVRQVEPSAAHLMADMQAGTLSPLAEWGSLRANRYDVVLSQGRPSAEMLAQVVVRFGLAASNPIVLFWGRVTARQRVEWSAYCRQHKISALLIDEVLLHFLASQRQTRLPATVSCGVTWGYANPYRSFGAIPPEVLKGRQHMVAAIADPRETALIYGGRQFGKSALLRMVQYQYHRPESGTYVFYEDIKPLGDPEGHQQATDVWLRLRDALVSAKLLPANSSEVATVLGQRIVDMMAQRPHLRIIVLLDEADNFLNADAAKGNFSQIQELRRITDETGRHFKVVFCGLHSVQRFFSYPNHPFAQLGIPLVVGPLAPRAALDLINDPMTAIGFSLDESVALRILCYTNYHPALIQQFCSELVNLVRQRTDEPPYAVSMADVEAVYRKEELRGFMRERFEWTLGLDLRYTAMVYAMVAEQLEDVDGYRREFTISQALAIAKQRWPAGFASWQLDEAKSLLDELVGLGVLVRRETGYRLRNGNVARFLGSQEEIESRLDQLTHTPAPAEFDPAQTRFIVDDGTERRSPLTVQQAGELTRPQSGVGLVFGSGALNLSGVFEALRTVMTRAERGGHVTTSVHELSPHVSSLRETITQLEVLADRPGRHVLYARADHLALAEEGIHASISQIRRRLARYSSRRRSVRFVVSFGAADTYRWLADRPDWESLEGSVDATEHLARWSGRMVERLLEGREIPSTPKTVGDVMAATGGWPWLLTRFWQAIRGETHGEQPPDPSRIARQFQADLESRDELRAAFVQALEVDALPHGRPLMRLISYFQPIQWDDIPDLLHMSEEAAVRSIDVAEAQAAIRTLLRVGVVADGEDGLRVECVAGAAVAQEAVSGHA
jgi:hypothetical protein